MSVGETDAKLISPATTPVSTQDEERCLTAVYPCQIYKRKWNSPAWYLVPCFMATVSIIQVLVFLLVDDQTTKLLRFEPSLRWQCYRFVTYMLIHWGNIHLVLNVLIQCVLAVILEVEQGGARTVAVYLGGGVFGALGACILQPQPMVGASAGIYSLLISHLAHLYLNFDSLKYKLYRLFCVFILAASDIVFCIVHTSTSGYPSISLGAHGFGGIAGLLLGLVIYKRVDNVKKTHQKAAFWCSLVVTVALFVVSVSLVVLLPEEFFSDD